MDQAVPGSPDHHAALVVMYHYIRDPEHGPFPSLKTLRTSEFAAQLDWLASVASGMVPEYLADQSRRDARIALIRLPSDPPPPRLSRP